MALTNVARTRDELITNGAFSAEAQKSMTPHERMLASLQYKIGTDAEHLTARLNERIERTKRLIEHVQNADFGDVGTFLREAAESFNDMVRDAATIEGQCDCYRSLQRTIEKTN